MKKFALVSLFLAAVLLTGCLSPRIDFTIEPKSITLYHNQTKLPDLKFKIALAGIGGPYTVEGAIIEVFDHEGKSVHKYPRDEYQFTIDFVIPGYKTERVMRDMDLGILLGGLSEEEYNARFLGRTYTLKITLNGANPTSSTTKLKFE